MIPTLVLVHGWGFTPSVWDDVALRLTGPVLRVDLGFGGRPQVPAVERPLVIGHSMGFAWALAHLPQPWAGAIAINGFARFTRSADFPEGVPPRLMERMLARFDAEPRTVATDFLNRCGVAAPDLDGLDPAPLGKALAWLAACDQRAALAALTCPLLALAGARDPIVPESMCRAAFAGRVVDIHANAGHLLPLTHADWVARHITAFARP